MKRDTYNYNSIFGTVAGFTLAEVLLTLAIVGIISAIVIPSLITNIQDAQYHTAFKEVFSDISQATLKMQTDNAIWDYGDGNTTDAYANNMVAAYKNYLNIVKTGTVSTIFNFQTPFQYNLYYGGTDPDFQSDANYVGGAQLNNGILMEFVSSSYNYPSGYSRRGYIAFDVNGPKGPNMWGRDVFSIGIYQSPKNNAYVVLPGGDSIVNTGSACVRGSSNYMDSRGCAYYVISGQPMP